MLGIEINNGQLNLITYHLPQITDSQLLIKVKATAVNRADLLQKKGKYPAPKDASLIPGLEIAGEIIEIGAGISDFKIGDSVMGLVNGGAYAEYCALEAALCTIIPADWSYTFAAAIPEALMTVHATLFEIGNLQKNQTLLIHGASSGISSLAIQMAKLVGARIITTVSKDSKMAKAYQIGATTVINFKTQDFSSIITENSIDLILDFIGGDYFNKHLKVLKPQGKLIQIACMKGAKIECDLSFILRKRLHIQGFMLRPQSVKEKAAIWKSAHERWFALFVDKKISPIIDSEFNLESINEAQQRMEDGLHFGKIVVSVG